MPGAAAWLARARRLLAEGRASQAVEACHAALALGHDDPAVLQGAAAVLVAATEYDGAETVLRRMLTLEPDRFDALANLGSVFFSQGRFDCAERAFAAALVQQPRHALTLKNRAAAQRALGNFPAALASYRSAVSMQPDLPEAHRDLGLMLLLLGHFAEGFAEYEWRWRAAVVGAPPLPGRRWTGDTLQGRRVVLHFEQGLGDTIQFLRYARLVAARGAWVAVCVQRPLAALAASVAGVAEIVPAGRKLPGYDVYAHLLSLPHALDTGPHIPGQIPYMSVPPARLEHWRRKLPPGAGRKIGLAWSGNARHENDRQRSMAAALLAPLTARPGARFYSLQPGTLPPAPTVDLGPLLTDFTETAAALACLDLLITVDTAVAHLAGALGRPVWLLLPFVPDWRWRLSGEGSPWYPTMRLFRQPRPGDWPAVIAAVSRALDGPAIEATLGSLAPGQRKAN